MGIFLVAHGAFHNIECPPPRGQRLVTWVQDRHKCNSCQLGEGLGKFELVPVLCSPPPTDQPEPVQRGRMAERYVGWSVHVGGG